MNKKNVSVICIIMLLICLCGCSCENKEKKPELVIGCDNSRPYCYTDEDGEFVGIDVELAKEVCKKIGYTPVFKQIKWNDRDVYLENGEVDCLWSCFSMDNQEDKYAWVGPYMYSRQVVAVLNNSSISKLENLEGKDIAVKISSKAEKIFAEQASENIPKVRDVYCLDDLEMAVTALRSNYVEACAGNIAGLKEELELAGVSYRILEPDLSRARLGIAFAKNSDSDFLKSIENAFVEMRGEGTTATILQKYGVETARTLIGRRR